MHKSLLTAMFLTFCPLLVAQEAAKPIVHIYRYKQYEGSALRPSVYCDGAVLGRIPSGRFLDVKIPPGTHTFSADDKQAGAVVNLEPGKEYFFRTDVQVGFWKGHFRLTMVLPEQGKYDLAKLKPLDSADAVHDIGGAMSAPAPPSAPAHDAAPGANPSDAIAPSAVSLSVDSSPTGADIEIDGAFVGDTPSTVTVASGSHQIAVKKKGFTDWNKTLNVTGGTIHLNAELEQAPAAK